MSGVLQETKSAIGIKAAEFISKLPPEISAEIIAGDFRPYMGKVRVFNSGVPAGKAVIYWSPKKGSFSLSLAEVPDLALHELFNSAFSGRKIAAAKFDPTKNNKTPALIAYVDGSCMVGRIGYGLAVYDGGVESFCESGPVPDRFSRMRQVGGEIYAAMRAVSWANRQGLSEIAIAFDYNGIQKWATGEWKTNLEATREYAAFMREAQVKVTFIKIAAHTGVAGNERADELAKQATITET